MVLSVHPLSSTLPVAVQVGDDIKVWVVLKENLDSMDEATDSREQVALADYNCAWIFLNRNKHLKVI